MVSLQTTISSQSITFSPSKHVRTRSNCLKCAFSQKIPLRSLNQVVICNSNAHSELPSTSSPATATSIQFSSLKKHSWEWKGYNTKYITAGCGPPVILVHGFGASAGHYRNQITFLANNGYKVYALDLLGFGDSEKPIIDYSMEIWEQQIADFMNEFIDAPAIIMGNSVGSLASLMVSVAIPDHVRGLVLFNCAGGMNNKAISDDWRIKVAMPIFLLVDWLLKQPKIARSLFDNVRATDNLKKVLESVYPKNPRAVDDELVQMLHRPSSDVGALETFVSCITGPPGPRPEELIPKVTQKMLIIWGTSDPFTPSDGPVGKYFQSLPSQNSDITFIHLEGAGHCPMDELPDQVHDALLPWLKSISNS